MISESSSSPTRSHFSHNFLGLPAHARLRALLAAGALGRVSSAEVHWCLPFAPLRSGPFTIWPLRAPANLVRELAPHPLAFVHDLFGPAEVLAVVPGHPVTLPGGAIRHQSLRALLRAGGVEVSVILSTVEVTDERAVSVRGSSGRARLDYAADTLVHDGENSAELVLNPALRQAGLAWAHLREGAVNAARQGLSLNRRSAYAQGFIGAFGAFYGAIAEGGPPDPRFAPAAAVAVTDLLDRVVAGLPDAGAETRAAPAPAPAAARAPVPDTMVPDTMVPDTMVIGGTGFIGAALTRALVARGHAVRVLSRGTRSPFPDLPGRVEVVAAPQDDAAALARAMDGCRTIFHLGRALETTWEGALKNDVGVTETIARAALAAGVGRLIYTGTIASHAMADPGRTITDDTPLPDDMGARNLYARSKAECERRLLALHRAEGLPLVIARPGIVVGPGGPLQHWGIGRWHGAGAVRLW
ncbi:MAG: NAD-dependent epimerase/dehydratase family protein, partial [Rhodobacteraceae bacterium]|nr:NAD-dependent epimerase/dehydratase family protein [Paracoccaceae bacterium]